MKKTLSHTHTHTRTHILSRSFSLTHPFLCLSFTHLSVSASLSLSRHVSLSCLSIFQSVYLSIYHCLCLPIYICTHIYCINQIFYIFIYIYILLAHSSSGWRVRWWPARLGFNPRSSHIKDSKKFYFMPPCLTLSIMRYGSKVKWSNPGKRMTPSLTPWCSSK